MELLLVVWVYQPQRTLGNPEACGLHQSLKSLYRHTGTLDAAEFLNTFPAVAAYPYQGQVDWIRQQMDIG